MIVEKDKVVAIEYSLSDANGDLLDSNEGLAPQEYLHGAGNIIVGLEQALEGMIQGDSKNISISPELAYGFYDEQLVYLLPVENYRESQLTSPGDIITLAGGQEATILRNTGNYLIADANHPLAGQTLQYQLKVFYIRDARHEELLHRCPLPDSESAYYCGGERGCC